MLDQIMADKVTSGGEGNSGQWARVRPILEFALDLPRARRAAYLEDVCAGDSALRAEVEALIAGADESVWFDRPALAQPNLTATMAAPAVPGLQRDQVVGNYRIVDKIGQGGMGAVYKAIDQRLNRTVALKIILRDGGGDAVRERRRFAQEAKAASALNHPNIATIYEYDSLDGMDYIAMEYIEGASLDRLMGSATVLPVLLDYAAQAARAMQKAHDAGVVHRDLKPANIMVTREGAVKVLDFGLARRAQSANADPDSTQTQGLTQTGAVVGTPAYMSPEHVMGEAEDWRSDIFSFGIILYELTCGRRPFEGKTLPATLSLIAHQDAPPVTGLNPKVPPALAALIARCLKKDPAQRPQAMAEIAVAIDGLAQAPPAPRVNSRRMLMAGVVLCAAVIAAGLWFSREPPRTLTYRIEVEKLRDGQPLGNPYTASAGDTFEGVHIRLRTQSPQVGYLYVINQGLDEKEVARFWMLHPKEPSTAPLAANQEAVTAWLGFEGKPGTEKFWIVWSPRALEAFEASLGGASQGRVDSPESAAAIQRMLAGLKPPSREAQSNGAVRLQTGDGTGILGEVLELKHR